MESGESVDISGMRIKTSRRATPEDIEKVKKIGYTIGGSILATMILSILIIGGVILAIFYFTWSAIDKTIPTIGNRSTSPQSPVVRTATSDEYEIMRIGGEGTGAGRFKDNRHVAVDGAGRIYSSDYSPHRIQVFDGEGKFINQWAPETGSNLYDLVADRDGNVYLANDKGIFKHEGQSGKLIAKSTNLYPRGIALTWDGKIIAAAGKSIVVLNNSLKALNEFKDAAASANSTFGFEKLAADGSGVIYALDSHNNEICKFSSEGKFLNRFKTEANAPHALAVDPRGRIFLSDTNMMYVLDTDGQVVGSFITNQAFGIAFDQADNIFIASRPYVVKRKLTF
jgi:DNA-binding beta-propeller fold protein YncE